jgi:hypothetical protein
MPKTVLSQIFSDALALIVSACAPAAKLADDKWSEYGEKAEAINHDAWDRILAAHVRQSPDGLNRVDYNGIKANVAELNAYVAALQSVRISEYPRPEQSAFWVNLYNAATVQVIIENYPLASIRKIGLLGPWRKRFLTVDGRKLSLDDIEHGILRPIWKDVRIHYAVNCASVGCPNLAIKAYRAETLEPMLEQAARAYINDPRGFKRINGELIASSIFQWYQVDWGSAANVLAHARTYANAETAKLLEGAASIDGYDYDWALNQAQ